MLNSLRRLFGAGQDDAPQQRPLPPPDPEPEDDTDVPEISVEALRAQLDSSEPPLLLDIREDYEWRQVHLVAEEGWDLRHVPMNSVPEVLAALPQARPIVVICAHGNRSYGVAHYLNEQGFRASSLAGGITRWAAMGHATARA